MSILSPIVLYFFYYSNYYHHYYYYHHHNHHHHHHHHHHQIADTELWKHRLSKTIDFLKEEVYSSSSSGGGSSTSSSSNSQQEPGKKISTAIIGLTHIFSNINCIYQFNCHPYLFIILCYDDGRSWS